MIKDNKLTGTLKEIRTRLNKFSDEEQGHLINWGYALTDTAMRKHVLPEATQPGSWPDPKFPRSRLFFRVGEQGTGLPPDEATLVPTHD